MTLFSVAQGKSKFLLSLKSRLCCFFGGVKNSEVNKPVIASNAGNVFAQALIKVNTSYSTTISGSFPLVLHVDLLRHGPEIRPDIVVGHSVNVVNIFWPIPKHQKCRDSMDKINFAEHSKSGIPVCIQGWAYKFSRIASVVFSAPAFSRISWVGVAAWLKHIWCSCKPSKLTSLGVVFNSPLNQFVNVCHNSVSPMLFDTSYTSLRKAHQGA